MRIGDEPYEQFDEWVDNLKHSIIFPDNTINDIGCFTATADRQTRYIICMYKPDKPPVDCDNKPLPRMGDFKDLVFYYIENAGSFEEAAMRYYVD
jgi:hypothetical protein